MAILNTSDIQVILNSSAEVKATIYNGARGKSAWEIWVEEGHTGPDGGITYEDFLQWMRIQTAAETLVEDAGGWYTPTPGVQLNVEQVLQQIGEKITSALANADKHYTHNQGSPSDTWVIVHNLDKFPSVRTFDLDDKKELVGNILFDSANQVTVTFSAPFAGVAYLN